MPRELLHPELQSAIRQSGWSGDLLERILRSAGERWTTRAEDKTPYFLDVLAEADSNTGVSIVSGDLSPGFWEQESVASALRGVLQDGVPVRIIFGNESALTLDAVKGHLRDNNPGMSALINEFPQHLTIKWSQERPRLHFTVAGNMAQHDEPDNHRGINPYTLTKSGKSWAKHWRERFDKLWKTNELATIAKN